MYNCYKVHALTTIYQKEKCFRSEARQNLMRFMRVMIEKNRCINFFISSDIIYICFSELGYHICTGQKKMCF